MKCQECGTKYEPMTDAYKCPCCGAENYPDEADDDPDAEYDAENEPDDDDYPEVR